MTDKENQFNNILDECLDRMMLNGETPEQCLASYPEFAEELRPLLETALITSGVTNIEPRPEFRNKARAELQSVLRESEVKNSRSLFSFSWQRRFASIMAGVIAVLTVTGGTAAASRNVMPDNFLYPVKLITENLQLAFTFTDLGKAETYARLADKRVDEIVYLANKENADIEEIDTLTTNLNSNLINIAEYSSRQTTGTESRDIRTGMKAVTTEEADYAAVDDSNESLTLMAAPEIMEDEGTEESVTTETAAGSGEYPEASTETGEASAEDISPVIPEVTVEIPPTKITVSPQAPGSGRAVDPVSVLNASLVEQANSNINRLYELLEMVPESIRPVIKKAISLAEMGYNIAINSTQ